MLVEVVMAEKVTSEAGDSSVLELMSWKEREDNEMIIL